MESLKEPLYRQRLVGMAYGKIRRYRVDIEGRDNLPPSPSVFCVNHSNSWDLLTTCELFVTLGRAFTVFAATDCLNPLTSALFRMLGYIMFDRRSKAESGATLGRAVDKLKGGKDVVIFGESTWNLHPYKPMQNVKPGAVRIAAETGARVVPTIYEYVEVPRVCGREPELYDRCLVSFGRPLPVGPDVNPLERTEEVKRTMESMRLGLWEELGIDRSGQSEGFVDVYLNHTYLKKFGAFGFRYDSEYESQFLYFAPGEPRENEFCCARGGGIEPGVTPRAR